MVFDDFWCFGCIGKVKEKGGKTNPIPIPSPSPVLEQVKTRQTEPRQGTASEPAEPRQSTPGEVAEPSQATLSARTTAQPPLAARAGRLRRLTPPTLPQLHPMFSQPIFVYCLYLVLRQK